MSVVYIPYIVAYHVTFKKPILKLILRGGAASFMKYKISVCTALVTPLTKLY